MKSQFESLLGTLLSFWQIIKSALENLGEKPDEMMTFWVTPAGALQLVRMIGFGLELKNGPKPGKSLAQQLESWRIFYKKFFNHKLDFADIKIPPRQDGFDRLIVVAKGFSLNQIYDALAKQFTCWRYEQDLDKAVPHSDRDANKTGTYAIWVRDRVEADEENKNKSANRCKEEKIQGVTLAERMLDELMFWDETGEHLDANNVTLCAGSRCSGGGVPDAGWSFDGSEFRVHWSAPGSSSDCLRTRSAVSLPA